jgi:MATE family multidrug resistance protein
MATIPAQTDLRVKTSYKQILAIAVPIAAAMLVPQFNFITNNIFLSGLGQKELALAGITGVYYLIFAVIGMGLNNGLQTMIARRAGENKIGEIGNIFNQGAIISFIIAAFGIVSTFFIAPYILKRTLHSTENVELALHFLYIRIWGLPFLYIYQMRNALLVGTNNSRFLVIGTLAETVANIVFDYGLIYGKLGMPKLGFNGAAYASIIAEIVGLVIIFLVMRYKGITKRFKLFSHFEIDWQLTKTMLRMSAPLILQYALSIVSWEFFYILIEHHGVQALAISNTMRNIFGFFGCFTWAFAATTTTMVSNVIGQGLKEKVIELVWKIIKLSLGFAVIVVLILNIFPVMFLKIYGQGDDFIQAAIPVVRIVSVALLFMSVSIVWLNSVVGTGNTAMNLLTETIAIIAYCTYNYYVLEYRNLPIEWGWASEWLYWMVLFIPSFWYMQSGRWKKSIKL